jgi:hypothetical protein
MWPGNAWAGRKSDAGRGGSRLLDSRQARCFDRRREADKSREASGPPGGVDGLPAPRRALALGHYLSRKASLEMPTQQAGNTPRRLRATIIGLGLDGEDSLQRLITGPEYLLVGGSAETHAAMVETMLRLESELERLGQRLGDLTPAELADIAWRIDSPELHQVALRLERGLELQGRTFQESTAEQLTELSADLDS